MRVSDADLYDLDDVVVVVVLCYCCGGLVVVIVVVVNVIILFGVVFVVVVFVVVVVVIVDVVVVIVVDVYAVVVVVVSNIFDDHFTWCSGRIQSGCPSTQEVDVQLLLDSSGSMGENSWTSLMEIIKIDFIDPIFNNVKSRLAIARYGTKTEVLQ